MGRKADQPRTRPAWMTDDEWAVMVEIDRRAAAAAPARKRAARRGMIRVGVAALAAVAFIIATTMAAHDFAEWIDMPGNLRTWLGVMGVAYLVARLAAPAGKDD